jgi:transcriptional regulator
VYLPPHFRQTDLAAIRAFVRAARLATLFTAGPGGPRASHIPVTLEARPEPYGTLRCHLSRANEQWRDLAAGAEALVAFLGPEAYVSPSMYATKRETGKVVPTWNYVAVHAVGKARVFHDTTELHELVSSLTDGREAERPEPWRVDDAPETYVEGQLRGIVGVEIPVARFEAKWKMSQNRSEPDVEGVVEALRRSPLEPERETAEIMAELLTRRESAS